MTEVTSLGNDLYLLDAMMHDEPGRLACYLFDTPNRVLIECGPSRSIGHLYDALGAAGAHSPGAAPGHRGSHPDPPGGWTIRRGDVHPGPRQARGGLLRGGDGGVPGGRRRGRSGEHTELQSLAYLV